MSQRVMLQSVSATYDVWSGGKIVLPWLTSSVDKQRTWNPSWDDTQLELQGATLDYGAVSDADGVGLMLNLNDQEVIQLYWDVGQANQRQHWSGDITTLIENSNNLFDLLAENAYWLLNGATISGISMSVTLVFKQLVTGSQPPPPNSRTGADTSAIPWVEIATYGGIAAGVIGSVGAVAIYAKGKGEEKRAIRVEATRQRREEERERKEEEREKRSAERLRETMLLMRGGSAG